MGYKELRGQSCQRCPQDLVPETPGSAEVRGRDSKFIIFKCKSKDKNKLFREEFP